MSYTIHITVNLPDSIEVDLPAVKGTEVPSLWQLKDVLKPYEGKWTSLVITVVNDKPPKAIATFID